MNFLLIQLGTIHKMLNRLKKTEQYNMCTYSLNILIPTILNNKNIISVTSGQKTPHTGVLFDAPFILS